MPFDCDLIYIMSNPSPTAIDLLRFSSENNKKVALIHLERGRNEILFNKDQVSFKIFTIDVPYKEIEIKRFISFPNIYLKIRRIITKHLKPNGIIITSSYDTLFQCFFINFNNKYRIFHQSRDLNRLQLANSIISRLFIQIERMLLSKVEKLIITSNAFYTHYYQKHFSKTVILLENIPKLTIWKDFERQRNNDVITIGYVGIIRYYPSLFQLIEVVDRLISNGIKVNVIFAGGGDTTILKNKIKNPSNYIFLGPYEYSKDIKNIYKNIDVIYSLYDSFDKNCQLAMPNKFYESIITKIPIIVAKNTFVSQEVQKLGIGISIMTGDNESLLNKIMEINNYNSWYKKSIESLNNLSIDEYQNKYVESLKSIIN